MAGGDAAKRLNIRLAAEDHKALSERAGACGLTISDYVRYRCLEDDGRPRIVVDDATLKALYRDQRRIGGLLNQLLRHANTRRQDFPELAAQARQVLDELGGTTKQISELMADARIRLGAKGRCDNDRSKR